MPNDKFDSKSFNPQAFKYMVGRVPNLHMHEIKKSKALAGNPDIKATLGGSQGGTGYASGKPTIHPPRQQHRPIRLCVVIAYGK